MCSCDSNFRFQIHQWRKVIQPAVPAPPHPFLCMTVDPSFTVRDGSEGGNISDESAIAVGFSDDGGLLKIFHCAHGRFRGMALPDKIVSVAEQWPCSEIRVERNPFYDLLTDAIKLKAELRHVEIGRIVPFVPTHSKKHRIARLQNLVASNPPRIRINSGLFVPELLKQVENFCFKSKSNHRHEDGILDVISMQANFR